MGAKDSDCVTSIRLSLTSSSTARKLTTKTGTPRPGSNSSPNSANPPLRSLRRIRLMCSRTESSSRVTRWCCVIFARTSRARHASSRSAAFTCGRRCARVCSIQTSTGKKSRPSCGSASSLCPASFIFSYSSRRRTSSARGSSPSSPGIVGRGRSMRDLISISIAAEYLVMAAMLMEIKSRMLLPRPTMPGAEGEDPRAELVRRLLEYEKMKLAGQRLDALPQRGRDFFPVEIWIDQTLAQRLPQVNVVDLQEAWRALLVRAKMLQHHRVTREELSVREHMSLILRRLRGAGFAEFGELFEPGRGLAVLELVRESLIEVTQSESFAPIYVKLAHAQPE